MKANTRPTRAVAAAIVVTMAAGAALAGLGIHPAYAADPGAQTVMLAARAAPGQTGVSSTVNGVAVSLQELRSRREPAKGSPREASPRRTFGGAASQADGAGATATSSAKSSATGNSGLNSPQSLADEIIGPQISDTIGYVPPDTMGAVGPTQFLFSVNGRFRGYNKNTPHTQIFDIDQATFWGSTADPSGVSDAHVRYDSPTQRWFITEIDVPTGNNHILLAVSSGPDLATASWTQFQIPATGSTSATDAGCFADYDTPGIDQNGIYIGANMFGGLSPCVPATYKHTNLYVVQKSSALTLTLHVTSFFSVVTGTVGIETIQGVDSLDALATGYAVAVTETESPRQHLNVWQINSPGTTTPTLSGPTTVAISAENGARGGVLSANNVASANPTRPMDDIDDRLFSAVIRNGHLWTAHNVGVDSSGNSNGGTRTRDAVRWYDVNVSGLTLNQSGTVFDGATSGFLQYWMGTLMVSGQGHVAMGLNRANSTTVVQAGAVGRLAGDPLGTMGAFSLFQNSTTDAYDDASFVKTAANRWGDYTYTSLDPCDDLTMWTTQEYVAGPTFSGIPIDWGVAAEKLLAPPPAAPSSASPSSVQTGQSSVNVVVTGSSSGGSGFYDTPSTLTDPCRKRITATVSGGVTVNSVSYTDPTHVTLNISTVGATAGSQTVTITNPDGQSSAAAILTIPQWSVRVPPSGGSSSTFNGVAAIAANDVWAVGSFIDGTGTNSPMTEHWDGTQWNMVVPPKGGTSSTLQGVAAAAGNDVWAVGSYTDSGAKTWPFTEHWNGTAWSVVVPPAGGVGSTLNGVTEITGSDVWAVGSYDDGAGHTWPLTYHWDGTAWNVIVPPAGGVSSTFNSVSAASSGDVWAVGSYNDGNGHTWPLAEHWNGTVWSINVPPAGGSSSAFNGVSVVSSTDVWAVGYFQSGTSQSPLTEHWNGSSWTVRVGLVGGSASVFNSVAEVGSSDVWAVGTYFDSAANPRPLAEHWDGVQWNMVPPVMGGTGGTFTGVAKLASNDVWAVGTYNDSASVVHPLAEHYN
jgi:hypothetical protein